MRGHPDGPVVRTCRGYRFDPWLGSKIPHAVWHGFKKKKVNSQLWGVVGREP